MRIPPALYTTQALVTAFNEVAAIMEVGNLEITAILQEETNLVRLTMTNSADTDDTRFCTLYYPRTTHGSFKNSVWGRMGFSRLQVSNMSSNSFNYAAGPNGNFIIFRPIAQSHFLIFHSKPANIQEVSSHFAQKKGHESHEMLYLCSKSLVSDSVQTHSNPDNYTTSVSTSSIMQQIPITTNIYSWQHLLGSETLLTHQLSGRTVSGFDIFLTDKFGGRFASTEHSDFTLCLEFVTTDIKLDDEIIKKYCNQTFKKQYSC